MGTVKTILQQKNSTVFTIEPDASVFSALEKMVENNVGALLVVSDKGTLEGIFTERDYARRIILKGKASKETLVKEVMSEHPVTVSPDTSLEECMQLMTRKYIRYLPVIDHNSLVGLVSTGDIVKHIIEEQKFIIDNLEHYIVG